MVRNDVEVASGVAQKYSHVMVRTYLKRPMQLAVHASW